MKKLVFVVLVAVAACSSGIQNVGGGASPYPVMQQGAAVESLPPIPTSLPSPLGPVPVVLQDTLINEAGQMLMGGFMPTTRTIYLWHRITNRVVLWTVLRHEQCHLVLWDAGLRNFFADDNGKRMADVLCDAFATARVEEMLALHR